MRLQASLVRYAGGAVLDRHAHPSGSVSIVLAGSIEEEVGHKAELGRIGSMVAKPAGVEHRNRVGRDGAILLAITGKHADEIAAPGWRWNESRGAAGAGLRLARSLKAGARVDSEQLIDLLAFAAGPFLASNPPRANWLSDVRSRLDRESRPPSVRQLAEEADVHPVYLTRAFRKHFGCSVREYRRNVRVQRAARLLAGSNLPIASIAADLDFFDQSHLCRDFMAEMRISPSDYRAIVRG